MSETSVSRPLRTGDIYAAMIAIAAEIPSIAKVQKNAAQGYVFRGVDDVFNALQPVLSRHGVFMSCEILDLKREERPTKSGGVMAFVTTRVRYSFIAKDGSSVSTESAGEGADAGDKATAKSLSIALKYALLQTFLVPTADAKDPEVDSPELAPEPMPQRVKAVIASATPGNGDDFMDEPAAQSQFHLLDKFTAAKKQLGDALYYEVLARYHWKHATDVPPEERAALIEELRMAYKMLKPVKS